MSFDHTCSGVSTGSSMTSGSVSSTECMDGAVPRGVVTLTIAEAVGVDSDGEGGTGIINGVGYKKVSE